MKEIRQFPSVRKSWEAGKASGIAIWGHSISQLASVSRDLADGQSHMMESLIEESDAKKKVGPSDDREPRVKARYGLRGVRVGEASNPGPSQARAMFHGTEAAPDSAIAS